ncbi:MAG: tetratricopeptide repeat protein [Gammaproteobacteria bacterium]|nr:tetratricopeptide repeat protein [Gammaproteobacteria bacterium]
MNNMLWFRIFPFWLQVGVIVVMTGCVSTPDMTPLPAPDISSSTQIDDSIRRPTAVYEYPGAGTQGDSVTEMEPLSKPPTYSNETTSSSRTVLALLDQATKMEEAGNPEKAAATLERALRIEPRNARLWHRLAVIRYQQGQYTQAESLAAKSSTLAQDDWELKRKNAELIERVRQQRPYIR